MPVDYIAKALDLGYEIEETPNPDDDIVIVSGFGMDGCRASAADTAFWKALTTKKLHDGRVEYAERAEAGEDVVLEADGTVSAVDPVAQDQAGPGA